MMFAHRGIEGESLSSPRGTERKICTSNVNRNAIAAILYLSDHDRDCLTNLRFADDVMLFATSKEQIRKMMCDFKKATEKVGLRIHPDKTILSNQGSINSNTKNILKSVK